jgi:hypothetical protein
MKKLFIVLFLLLVPVHPAIAKAPPISNGLYIDIGNAKIEDAPADAQKAIAAKDYRLLVIKRLSQCMPGISCGQKMVDLSKKYGYRIVKGASDQSSNPTDKEFNDRADAYAAGYNQTILEAVNKDK